jgi:hypothetical protein
MRLMTDTLVIGYYEGRKLVDRRIVGPDAIDNRVDVDGYALRLIDEDEARLGRPRARSGAEKLLRAAGFSDPSRTYAFAMDRRARNRYGVIR